MSISSYDQWLSTEPDQKEYDKWLDQVLSHITDKEIPQTEWDEHFDKIIEPGLLSLSISGTNPHGFVTPDFAADVIKNTLRWRKQYFPDCNTWAQLRERIKSL